MFFAFTRFFFFVFFLTSYQVKSFKREKNLNVNLLEYGSHHKQDWEPKCLLDKSNISKNYSNTHLIKIINRFSLKKGTMSSSFFFLSCISNVCNIWGKRSKFPWKWWLFYLFYKKILENIFKLKLNWNEYHT